MGLSKSDRGKYQLAEDGEGWHGGRLGGEYKVCRSSHKQRCTEQISPFMATGALTFPPAVDYDATLVYHHIHAS